VFERHRPAARPSITLPVRGRVERKDDVIGVIVRRIGGVTSSGKAAAAKRGIFIDRATPTQKRCSEQSAGLHRGDSTPIELFLEGVRVWEPGIRAVRRDVQRGRIENLIGGGTSPRCPGGVPAVNLSIEERSLPKTPHEGMFHRTSRVTHVTDTTAGVMPLSWSSQPPPAQLKLHYRLGCGERSGSLCTCWSHLGAEVHNSK